MTSPYVETTTTTRAYADFDRSRDPEAIIDLLDGSELMGARVELRKRIREELPGGAGVDVGCGTGGVVAELVQQGVLATGVDRSEIMVRTARQRHPSCRYLVADATRLPFPDGTLRWYRAERVFTLVHDSLSAVVEARRVLAPGGKAIIAEPDYDSLVIPSSDPDMTRRLLGVFTDDLPHGRIGSRIPALLAQAGFTDITISAAPMVFLDLAEVGPHIPEQAAALAVRSGVVSPQQADAWVADLRLRDADDRFLCAYIAFITTATAY